MNKLSKILLKGPMLVALMIFCGAITSQAQTARLQLGHLDNLARKASETVDINVDERLIQLTAKFLGKDADDEEVRKVITGLKGIYVKSFEFENPGEYSEADMESIRSQVRSSNWSKVLDFKSKKDGSIEVYLMTSDSQIGGLVVLATEPKEFTVVNILGPINLEKLAKLEGQFGIPDLESEASPKPKQKN
jgi:Domain of unknown function (DUF4252)